MKQEIIGLVQRSISELCTRGELPVGLQPDITLSRSKNPSHGDFACNVALNLAKPLGKSPRAIAASIVASFPQSPAVQKVEIAGPGFINIFLTPRASTTVVERILAAGSLYGHSNVGRDTRVQLEFVSANPTGPLHVGHGRGAAYGSAVAGIMRAAGYSVECEYYINDADRQMDILATSVWLRYLAKGGVEIDFPSNGYRGDYILEIADHLRDDRGATLMVQAAQLTSDIPADEPAGGDKETHIDALIERAKLLLGKANYEDVFSLALGTILGDIRADLQEFGVEYDTWFSERSLFDSGEVESALQDLEQRGHTFQDQGALWFRASDFGDDKDRVVRRDNSTTTYFASDIAYLRNKLERGFDKTLYIFGADHHGYVPRLKAMATALGLDTNKLEFPLIQFAALYRDGKKIQMSTRSGQFETLRALREEIGRDAARYFYLMRRHASSMDFDLNLAKTQSNDNPVYYVQYAHARICQVFRQLHSKELQHDQANGSKNSVRLTEKHENALLESLAHYPEVIETAAYHREPHLITNYLRNLASAFHAYYNAHQILIDDANLRDARLNLCLAVQQTLANALGVIGVSAPSEM
ncbi:MAG: arginine--tRNA ligase [Granulosicoccaceae bacterium]